MLILITMIGHDAARQGEGIDLWEFQSTQATHEFLLELGLKEQHASLFSQTILNKDNPVRYASHLKSLGIQEQDIAHFSYLRTLINLGDNLDLPRFVGIFESQYIFKTLMFVDGFNADLHAAELMGLLKEIHHIIYQQGDMLFSCKIITSNKQIVTEHESRFIVQIKIGFEHASNVLAALYEDLASYPTIEPLLKGIEPPHFNKYTLEMAYDPYMHGTNSSILALLPKSDFNILSPIEMMATYKAAPMTGELTLGGYSSIANKTLGKTSFAKLSTREMTYTLERVKSMYTHLEVGLGDTNSKLFKNEYEKGFAKSYTNINLILIYFVRARQSFLTLDEIINQVDLTQLIEKIEGSIQFYYFIQLLGTYIFPDIAGLNQFFIPRDKKIPEITTEMLQLAHMVENYLTYSHIVQKIIDNKLNVKEILGHPTPENLVKALALLELPEKDNTDVKLPRTQCFSLKPDVFPHVKNYVETNAFDQLLQGEQIGKLLSKFIYGYGKNKSFIKIAAEAETHCKELQQRLDLFKNLIQTPQQQFLITEVQKYFLERQFPIILLSEAEEEIALLMINTGEYRSRINLKLGSDIKIIATDTHLHRLEVLKYLQYHHINHIQVILISELDDIRNNHNRPTSPQHHSGGIPTLKWLAAQKVPVFNAQQFKNQARIESSALPATSQLHSEGNRKGVLDLLQDAQTYGGIQFEPCCALRCTSPLHHEVIQLLTEAEIPTQEFKHLIGYAAINEKRLIISIKYLADLKLPQWYREALTDKEFASTLALLSKRNVTEYVTAAFLANSELTKYIYLHRSKFDAEISKAFFLLYKHAPQLLNEKTIPSLWLKDELRELIVYFSEHNLYQHYTALLEDGVAYLLRNGINLKYISSTDISIICNSPNLINMVNKNLIDSYRENAWKAAFILADLDIVIDFKISTKIATITLLLNSHGISDREIYFKAFSTDELKNALLDNKFDSSHQINAVFKAHALGCLNSELLSITNSRLLCKMVAFADTQTQWDTYKVFCKLLTQLRTLQNDFKNMGNLKAFEVASRLIDDLHFEIDNCFSKTNLNPDKFKQFTDRCNERIELARSVLEINSGLIGMVDSALFGISYLNPANLIYPQSKEKSYSFFKNDAAEVLETMKNTLTQMYR